MRLVVQRPVLYALAATNHSRMRVRYCSQLKGVVPRAKELWLLCRFARYLACG
ncbi:hypothetical protein XHC_0080 [Xanthomonas hortorum pv. carotae str. M081]|nr:hypothetical protein XHC_0080 [Xanthomonas hortorum pv. carotae str. M081]